MYNVLRTTCESYQCVYDSKVSGKTPGQGKNLWTIGNEINKERLKFKTVR